MSNFGTKVKEYRKRNEMSLTELSKKVDVSTSFLSQIEKNKAFPSFSKLLKIADALKVSVGMLIDENHTLLSSPIVRKSDRRSFEHAGKGMTLQYLTHPNTNNQIEAVLHIFKQNGSSGNAINKHSGHEFILILKGCLEFRLDDKEYVLNEGDSICFNSDIPHCYKNIYEDITEALWVVVSPKM